MDCSAQERRLADLKQQRRDLKAAMELMPPAKLPEMNEQLDALNAQIDDAKAALEACQQTAADAAGKPPRAFTLRVKELYCAEASKELGKEEPYILVTTVDRLGQLNVGTLPVVGPVGFPKASLRVLHVGPWTQVEPARSYPPPSQNPSLWDLSSRPRALTSAEDAIFLVALMENDGSSPDGIRTKVEQEMEIAILNNANLGYEAMVETLASAMTGAIDTWAFTGTAPGHLNFDDRIDRAQHLALDANDLDSFKAGNEVDKVLWFVRAKNSGKQTDRYSVTFRFTPA